MAGELRLAMWDHHDRHAVASHLAQQADREVICMPVRELVDRVERQRARQHRVSGRHRAAGARRPVLRPHRTTRQPLQLAGVSKPRPGRSGEHHDPPASSLENLDQGRECPQAAPGHRSAPGRGRHWARPGSSSGTSLVPSGEVSATPSIGISDHPTSRHQPRTQRNPWLLGARRRSGADTTRCRRWCGGGYAPTAGGACATGHQYRQRVPPSARGDRLSNG